VPLTARGAGPSADDFPDLGPEALAIEPVERAWTIPSAWYREPRFEALDRAAVLGRSWQLVAHETRLAEPGRHVVAEAAGEPVVVVRGKDGVLRAFYNVCRHRGGPLALEDGCANALTCKYHGWTYLLDGTLRGVPQWDRVELFDRKDFGLVPVRVATWEGLVFVHLGEEPEPLERTVEGIAERIAPIRLDGYRFARRVAYDVACNWKVYVDNYLEGYHVPHVHPELMKLYQFGSYTTEVHARHSLQVSPLSEEDNIYAGGAGGTAYYYFLFPNAMLNILPGRLQTNLVLPTGPERCRVEFAYYYAETDTERARRLIEADHAYADHVQQEDIGICERVQVGLRSRAYERGRFSVQFEAAVHHFQALLKAAYRDWMAV
jgi:choline monooxygenase